MSPNMKAFLDVIAWSEGTTAIADSDDGYDVLVNGAVPDSVLDHSPALVRAVGGNEHVFLSYEDHPNILVRINSAGLTSTAAGRYQQMHHDWPAYRDLLGLPDFGHESQDAVAIRHIQECRATDDVEAGNIASALNKCRNIWASFPGNGYAQPQRALTDLMTKFQDFGGTSA